MSQFVNEFEESRQESKITHSLHDVTMSGFAMMYFQEPSLLKFQESLHEGQNKDNLMTLFDVQTIPKDAQMRNVLDIVNPEEFRPVFKDFLHRLQRGKHLEQYQLFDGSYLTVIDGTEYFASKAVQCACCLTKEHKNGDVTFAHQILQGAIVHPKLRQVIPVMPEQICNTDGTEKQDCELNAAKRFIEDLRRDHPQMKFTIGGDGLNSKQSMIELLREHRMNFILVAKPDDHKKMMEAVDLCLQEGEMRSLNIIDEAGRRHHYEWANDIPLNGNDETINVNFFRYELLVTDENGDEKVNYKNSWVTDSEISKS